MEYCFGKSALVGMALTSFTKLCMLVQEFAWGVPHIFLTNPLTNVGKFPQEKSPLFPKKFLFVGLGSFPSFPLKTFNKHGEVPSAKNPLFPKETPLCWIGELLSVPLKIL